VALNLDQLTVAAGRRQLLAATTRTVPSGCSLAVVGPSGSGKTSLLRVLAGLARPGGGAVSLDGIEIARVARSAVGVISQPVVLASLLTVAENISLPLQALHLPRDQIRAQTRELLDRLELHSVANRLPQELSGGQRQRVAVARAVVNSPRLVVADEPTSELDAQNRNRVLDVLLDVVAAGASLVLSSHDPEVAGRCDELLDLTAPAATADRTEPPGRLRPASDGRGGSR
jgi:putative ABC transport system ATP-binding protein